MSDRNLKFVAEKLQRELVGADGYKQWLDSGARAVVLDGDSAETAFEYAGYIIDPEQWRRDIGLIYQGLSNRQQPYFCAGLARCIDGISPSLESNDPSINRGRNSERLAIAFLSLAREIRARDALGVLPGLVQTKFPSSQSIYDSALLTWRLMADSHTQVDWHEVFCHVSKAKAELRYRQQYSPVIAFGMCLARPSDFEYFLYRWTPFQEYLVSLAEERDPESKRVLQALLKACKSIEDQGYALPGNKFLSPILLIKAISAGKAPNWQDTLSRAEGIARQEKRKFRGYRPSIPDFLGDLGNAVPA